MASSVLELVYSDICGKMSGKACHGAYIYDIYIRPHLVVFIYLIYHKSKALDWFR